MKRINLTKGFEALVDADDFEWLSNYSWYAQLDPRNTYAAGYLRSDNGKEVRTRMHRLIMGLAPGNPKLVDHINGDGLDNRKANLRICTRGENCRNAKPKPGTFKGVRYRSGRNKWTASIRHKGRLYNIGQFDSAKAAAAAYNTKAKELFGEFARLNIIE